MRVSIITVNYNNKEGLRKTIESVIHQNYNQFEFIVIDGGSDDGSYDVIQEYKEHIDYWVSEPDKGIYNAMNKGIEVASGEYCNFMNSGDCFFDNNVLTSIFSTDNKIFSDIIAGNTYWIEWVKAPSKITFEFLFGGTICHQCAFIRRNLLLKYKYDENLKIVSDRKFFIQVLINDNCSYECKDVNVVVYDLDGYSAKNRTLSELEYQRVLEELIPSRILEDYGKRKVGELFGTTYYEKLFIEIGKRQYKSYIYLFVSLLMRFISLFKDSARFIYFFPIRLKKDD